MTSTTWVLASNNPGKLAEFSVLLRPLGLNLRPQSDFGVLECAETGLSFVENAILKARHASQHTGLPALADDSGLCVDALYGAPGLYSARYAGAQAGDQGNVNKLLSELAQVPEAQRGAFFCCVLALLQHPKDPTPLIAEGRWHGRILDEPQGNHGFGYDPVFFVPEHGCSAAALAPGVKNRESHRGRAVARLLSQVITHKNWIAGE